MQDIGDEGNYASTLLSFASDCSIHFLKLPVCQNFYSILPCFTFYAYLWYTNLINIIL